MNAPTPQNVEQKLGWLKLIVKYFWYLLPLISAALFGLGLYYCCYVDNFGTKEHEIWVLIWSYSTTLFTMSIIYWLFRFYKRFIKHDELVEVIHAKTSRKRVREANVIEPTELSRPHEKTAN